MPKADDKPYKPKADDPIDNLLAKFMNEKGRNIISPGAIVRVSPGVYMFAKKTRVMIKEVNNKLIARLGGGWEDLETFVERFVALQQKVIERIKKEGGLVPEGVVQTEFDLKKFD